MSRRVSNFRKAGKIADSPWVSSWDIFGKGKTALCDEKEGGSREGNFISSCLAR
jgi:hypothetical protein